MKFQRTTKTEAAINIAPLVDVVFLLVIFFAVSTTFLETSGLKLELPSSSASTERKPEALTVLMDREGVLSFDQKIWEDEAELKSALKQALAGREEEESVVILRADTQVEHGDVVRVMDLIRTAGAKGLQVAARPGSE